MPLDDMLDDRETEARPAGGAASAWIYPIKPASEVGQMLCGDPFAMVAHRQDSVTGGITARTDLHVRIRMAVFERVVDEVADELLELSAVAAYHQLLGCLGQFQPR